MVFTTNRKEVFIWNSFLKDPPKDDYEEYARKVIARAYFPILNKIDELDGTNERLLEYYQKHIEKCIKRWYNDYATQI